ncbi:hypothetical protein [Microvirga makkahensis]|uniref:Uncharacterized protein n=1 Tax=Microvirga makkahensis TaxID=1128670 RepID=A0A7X3MUN5_9HYPH|nr:hypothetical protein [Microvirga makkahensis]MXQ13537.1 hypothetical protein [Microvirga makkahensis]
MTHEREQLIQEAIERAIGALAEEHTTVGAGGLFELAYPFVAADVPDASLEEVRAGFASVWGIEPAGRDLYEQVLAVCDRHSPGDDETIEQLLQRASRSGDVEATCLLALVKSTR